MSKITQDGFTFDSSDFEIAEFTNQSESWVLRRIKLEGRIAEHEKAITGLPKTMPNDLAAAAYANAYQALLQQTMTELDVEKL